MNNASTLQKEAQAWVVRLTSGAATNADAEDFVSWRAQSPAHDEAFILAARLWRGLGAVGIEYRRDQAAIRQSSRISRRSFIVGGLAASVAGVLAIRPPLGMWPSVVDQLADANADYATAIGKSKQVRLNASVSFEMNTRTRVNRLQDGNATGLEIDTGEAFVDASLPTEESFTVRAANCNIVLASVAQINVRHTGEIIAISCLEGKVNIYADVNGSVQASQLAAREKIIFSKSDNKFGKLQEARPELVSAWRRGLLVFTDEALASVIDEVNRYRSGAIVVTNASLAARRVSGTFHVNRIDEVLDHVARVYSANVTHLPGGVVLLG